VECANIHIGGITLVSEVEKGIFNCINNNESFVLEAGAGSGKTWTLIQTILHVLEENEVFFKKENRKIACITFTKVARDEIVERVSANTDNFLIVANTIHEFLWENIKRYNKEIKNELINYISEKIIEKQKTMENSRPTTKKYKEAENTFEKYNERLDKLRIFSGRLQYKNIPNWAKGVISHDEVLYIAHNIFKKFSVARKLLQDTFPIIFVDEYQDTSPLVRDILLEYLLYSTRITFGFFGDSMQQIYDKSMGKIDIEKYKLKLITKEENYRSSVEVINVLNKIRDDIQQIPTGRKKSGKCLFYYVNDVNIDAEEFIDSNIYKDFDLVKSDKIKRLYLTTASIARKNNYIKLHELYNRTDGRNKDEILKNKENRSSDFANYLYSIEEIVELYETNQIQQLLKRISYKLHNQEEKSYLNECLNKLRSNREKWTIGKVFEFVNETKILCMENELLIYYGNDETFTKDTFFLELIGLSYSEFKNLYYTVKENSPFITEHGTKGDEYDNVVCIINDNDWRNYNMNNYLDKSDFYNSEDRYLRTKKLFYVVCSRAKFNLAIINLSSLTDKAISEAKYIFGKENFI